MRGDIVFRVYGLHQGREKDQCFGAFTTRPEAEAQISKLETEEMNGANWAQQYHNQGFVIREHTVETDFEVPPLPKPRDKFAVEPTPIINPPGTWNSTLAKVWRRTPDGLEPVCEYKRNYAMLRTFEPFRQGDRELALISREYTCTAVLDLQSGEVIAEESTPPSFCPVGFYVPDWWDVNDRSIIPGSVSWDEDDEWPVGDFGFVWGCMWGDDSSWKVQYLDLSRVQQGEIRRDERFGYVELASKWEANPCFRLDSLEGKSDPPSFIQLSRHSGKTRVNFTVEMDFDLDSGKASAWERLPSSEFD